MTRRPHYHRDRMRRERWPANLAAVLAKLEFLLTEEGGRDGRPLPPMPWRIQAEWNLRDPNEPPF